LTWPKSDPQLVTGNWQTWQQPAGKFSFWRIFWHTLCCTDQRCLWVPFFPCYCCCWFFSCLGYSV